MTKEWNELDLAAKVNLPERKLPEFFRYKAFLCKQGHHWEEAKCILTGWIWDEIEASERLLEDSFLDE